MDEKERERIRKRAKKGGDLRRAAIEKLKSEMGGRGPASEEKSSEDFKSFEAEEQAKKDQESDERLSYFMKAKKNDPDFVKKRISNRLAEEAPELDLERKARMEYLRRKRQGK